MRWARLEDALKEKNITHTSYVDAKSLSTFRVGGTCRLLIAPACEGELIEAICLCRALDVPFVTIGNGSNLLFDDGLIFRAVICTRRLDACRFLSFGVEVAAGVSVPLLARRAAARGFGDLVFAAGIPASVGGAVVMNAGAHGKCLGDCVKSVTFFDVDACRKRAYINKELTFSYRKSDFQTLNAVVLRASLFFSACESVTELSRRIGELSAWRRATQPTDMPSAGSTFLRPSPDFSISALIDELGLKGMRVGGAAVSRKHAGFIVNLGGATAADVLTLIEKIQDIIQKERGFRPTPEIRLISNKT